MNLKNIFSRQNTPGWYAFLNYSTLLPLVFWPFVFLVSIFLFDNPKSFTNTFFFFLLINSYPLPLIALMAFNFRLFHKQKAIAILIPALILSAMLGGLYYVALPLGNYVYINALNN